MKDIINVAMMDKSTIIIDGTTYKVDDKIKAVCKKFLRIYQIMIAVFVVIGINVAPLIGSDGFFSDMLFVVLLLVVLSFIFNMIAKPLLRKVVS